MTLKLLVVIALAHRLNTLNDTDAACVVIALAHCLNMLNDSDAACGHYFSAVFKKEKNSICSKEWYKQRQKFTHGIQVTGTNLTGNYIIVEI